MARWPWSSTCQASKALAMGGKLSPQSFLRFGLIAVPLPGGARRRPRGRVRARSARNDVRGDGRAVGHRHSNRPPTAWQQAAGRAGPGGSARDLPLDAPPGADDARPKRASGLDARPQRWNVRRRAAAAGGRGWKAPGDDAWTVLDYRVAIETGATILAVERAQ